jgi:hypothetical protein
VKRVILALSVLSSLAFSSGIPVALERSTEVSEVIASARTRIRILAPSLRARGVADALRKALVEGGVHVQILCDANLVAERSSFVPILSLLRERKLPVEVRLLRGVTRTVLVVDESRAVFGALIAEPESFGLSPTRLVNDANEARAQTQFFDAQWKRATRWKYTITPPKFSNGGQK